MIQITFSEQDIAELQHERYHHPHPRVQMKMEALLLKAKGLPHHMIAECVNVSEPTLRSYLEEYQNGGIDALREIRFHRPVSDLEEHRTTLEAYFKEHPPQNAAQAAQAIEQITGIKRSQTQVRIFLKKIRLKRLKTFAIPAKSDLDEQEVFKEEQLEPRLEEARAGKRVVYFVDAAHFVFNCYLGFLWCVKRLAVRAPSGRKRWNVLGALHATTCELITVTNETSITSTEVCMLLHIIAQKHVGHVITIVLDNARYQHCARVEECAHNLGIELLFLPPYAPNFNLIERLWKFVKNTCLYSQYYTDFAAFKSAIATCLSETTGKHKQELQTLLTLKFQDLRKMQVYDL